MLQSENLTGIAIIDDHPIVIEGLRNLLEGSPGLTVKGCFTSGKGFISYLENNDVDIALLDISLPDGSGIHFCREIKQQHPATRVIAISNLSQRSIIQQMMQSGANGYLLKTAEPGDILAAIADVISGQPGFCKEIREMLSRPELGAQAEVPELTKREKQILALLAEGKRSADIAAELFISPLTVKTHRATLLQKFGVSNIVTLIKKAKDHQLL